MLRNLKGTVATLSEKRGDGMRGIPQKRQMVLVVERSGAQSTCVSVSVRVSVRVRVGVSASVSVRIRV